MPNESPWLSTETIPINNAAVTGSFKRGIRTIVTGFTDFILRDSVLEVCLGLIIATSFTAVVNSLITDIVLPPFSLIPNPFSSGSAGGLEEKFLILKPGQSSGENYNTRAQAIADGALILSYGSFANKLVNIIGISLVLFLFQASGVSRLISSPETANQHSVKCHFCRKEISSKALRCPMCTSWLDGREDRETSALAP